MRESGSRRETGFVSLTTPKHALSQNTFESVKMGLFSSVNFPVRCEESISENLWLSDECSRF